MEKVTIQDIADALGISRVSVWKVFSGREGVSEDLKNKIIAKAIDMNYNMPPQFYNEKAIASKKQYTISVAISRPETSSFWVNTIHEIAREASMQNANVLYTYLPSEIDSAYELPSVLSDGTVQGIIILNVYNPKMIQMLSKLDTPKVFMDTSTSVPFNNLNGDLILIEGRNGIYAITEHILKLGKKKIGFIGDIGYAQTNFERYYGFKDAMKDYNIPIDDKYCLTSPIGADTYQEEIEDFINGLDTLPDAFICVSDYVANIVCEIMSNKGLNIPEDILISGFDEISDLHSIVPLTTVKVDNQEFGMRLANQIIYRMKHPSASRELTYICPQVIFKKSTSGKNK